MALTNDEQRRCYKHLGYIQVNRTGVFVGGVPQTTEVVQKLQVSLDSITPNGETTVREYLAVLDPMWTELAASRSRMKATRVESITLNEAEFEQRRAAYDDFRYQLAVTLDVPLDPPTEAADGGTGGIQGPWREP